MKLVDEVMQLSRCTPEAPGTRIQSRNKQIGRAKIELKLGAAMVERTVRRRRSRKLTTVEVNSLDASRSTGEGDSRTSQGECGDALHWSGHGEPPAPARPDNGDGGGL
jgi:hypothetical protein